MRVYGSSPLYNYVELVFRSKRLFIVSIVLTTLVVASIAAMRAGTYSASAIIVLSGSSASPQGNEDAAQRGSVRYKLNILNVIAKDPSFFKEAFRDAGLDKHKNDEQFDEFCQNARKAIRFGTGENVLEITCQWKDPQAEDIVKAFYDAYARRVLSLETVMSTQTTKTLEKTQQMYASKAKELEDRLTKYQENNVVKGDMLTASSTALQMYQQKADNAKALENQLTLLRSNLEVVQGQLANTPKTIEGRSDFEPDQRSPVFLQKMQQLSTQRAEIDARLDIERQKHTDEHPTVKNLVAALKLIDDNINRLENPKAQPKRPNREVSRRIEPNPAYWGLSQKESDLEIARQGMEMQLANAIKERDEAYNRAKTMPGEIQKYRQMTEKLPLYQSIQANLGAKLEQARIDETRDREMHITEMKMMVDPIAEPDTGTKNIIFYAAGPLLGLLIAFAFSLLAETLDHSLRTPVEVEKYLGKPVLAVLPRMDAPKGSQKRLASGGDSAPPVLPSS